MKFFCQINSAITMKDFFNIITAVARIGKMCIMRLTENKMYLISQLDDKVPSAWAELSQSYFFDKYIMVGLNAEYNEIFLEFDATMLAKSLFSLKAAARSSKMKLTKQPCLSVEIELPSLSAQSRQVVHDIPIRVIPKSEWVSYKIPSIPTYDISLNMPELKHVRSVVERLKSMNTLLTIEADEDGHLSLKVSGFWADISTHFKELRVWEAKQGEVNATIDLKQFLIFSSWEIVHPENVKINILHQRSVNINFTVGDHLTIQYFIPAIEE